MPGSPPPIRRHTKRSEAGEVSGAGEREERDDRGRGVHERVAPKPGRSGRRTAWCRRGQSRAASALTSRAAHSNRGSGRRARAAPSPAITIVHEVGSSSECAPRRGHEWLSTAICRVLSKLRSRKWGYEGTSQVADGAAEPSMGVCRRKSWKCTIDSDPSLGSHREEMLYRTATIKPGREPLSGGASSSATTSGRGRKRGVSALADELTPVRGQRLRHRGGHDLRGLVLTRADPESPGS